MADFTFDVGALTGIQKAGETLLKEQDEANAARATHNAEVARLAAEKVKLASGAQQTIMEGAATAKAHLDSMDASLARVNEINDSWMLRAIEPIAGAIGIKNYSRSHLVQDIRTEEKALDTTIKRSEFQLTKLNAENKIIEAKEGASAAKLAIETGDVTSLASSMEILKTLRVDAESAREGLILNTETGDIGKLAEAGIISPRRAEKELQIRTSEKRRAQSEAISAALQSFQFEQAKTERLTIEDLRNPDKVKGLSPAYVQAEIQRKSQQEMAWQNSRLALEAGARASAAATMTDEELKAAGAAGSSGLTPYAAEQEVKAREGEEAKRQEQIKVWQLRAEAARRASVETMLTSSKIPQLRAALEASGGSGMAVFNGPKGEKIEISAKLVSDELKLKEAAEIEQAVAMAGVGSANIGLTSGLDEMERAVGIDAGITKGAPLADRLAFLMEQDDIDAETKNSLSIITAKMDAADKTTLSAQQRLDLQYDALAVMQKAQEGVRKSLLDSTGNANKPGVQEYIKTGKIEKAETAIPIVATSVITRETTGNKLYDQGLALLADRIAGKQADLEKKNKASTASLLDRLSTQDMDPIEQAASMITNPAIQREMAMPIIQGSVVEAHTLAMDAIGLKDMAAAMRNNQFFSDNVFDERQIITQLEERKINVADYMAKLREGSRVAAQRLTQPTGKGGAAIASLNKMYFSNQPEAYIEDRTMKWFNDAIKSKEATIQRAKDFQSTIDQISY